MWLIVYGKCRYIYIYINTRHRSYGIDFSIRFDPQAKIGSLMTPKSPSIWQKLLAPDFFSGNFFEDGLVAFSMSRISDAFNDEFLLLLIRIPYHPCMVYLPLFTYIYHKKQPNVGKYTHTWMVIRYRISEKNKKIQPKNKNNTEITGPGCQEFCSPLLHSC